MANWESNIKAEVAADAEAASQSQMEVKLPEGWVPGTAPTQHIDHVFDPNDNPNGLALH